MKKAGIVIGIIIAIVAVYFLYNRYSKPKLTILVKDNAAKSVEYSISKGTKELVHSTAGVSGNGAGGTAFGDGYSYTVTQGANSIIFKFSYMNNVYDTQTINF